MLPTKSRLTIGYAVGIRSGPLVQGRRKKQLLREMWLAKLVAFSVVGDIWKEHRRFEHAENEHGYLGCQIDETEEVRGDPDS